MKYLFHDDCILSASQNAIRFIKDDSVPKLEQVYNTNLRIFEITYNSDSTFSEMSGVEILDYDKRIDLEGDIILYPRHTVNGLTFTLKNSSGFLFSCFIDTDTSELTYEENEVGGWLIVPAGDVGNSDITEDIVTLINNKSEKFYVQSEEGFQVANIVGVDLTEKNVREEYTNIVPYGSYPQLYLTEADIIAGFIRECKKQFPDIEFFPQSSERKNLGKETIFYRSHISQDKSPKFNSNILWSPERERYVQTTIPIEMYYQTSDIKQYVHRRDAYLMSHFLMDVHYFDVVKQKGYTDRYGTSTETFNFATYWERHAVQNELMKTDANDGSGRDTYTLTMLCDLIGLIIEKSEKVTTVTQVITNLYLNNQQIYTDTKYKT